MHPLLRPRWLIAHVLVLAIGIGCLLLGFWQLDRWSEQRLENQVGVQRFEEAPLPIEELVFAAGSDVDTLEFRRATATGTFDADRETLVRSQIRDGMAGFEILTPLVTDTGSVVIVNRGWVPLAFDVVPVEVAPAPAGSVTVEGMVRPSARRGALGREDDPASTTVSRVDLVFLSARTGYDLLPVYLEVIGTGSRTQLPVPAPRPDFGDEGPHRDYALQWFGFALVGAVGYGFLLRRAVRSSGS